MTTLYSQDSREQVKHVSRIHDLVDELGFPEPEVEKFYEQEFHRLVAQAKVKDFLFLLIGRHVKESIKVQQSA